MRDMKIKQSDFIFTLVAGIIISSLLFISSTWAFVAVLTYFVFELYSKWKNTRGEDILHIEQMPQQDNVISMGTRIVKKGNLGFLHLDQYLKSIDPQVSRLILENIKKSSEAGGDEYPKKMLKIALNFEQGRNQGINSLKEEALSAIKSLDKQGAIADNDKLILNQFFSYL